MFGARTQVCKRSPVLGGAIPFMARKPVAGKMLVKLDHQAIPPYFGHNGGGRDREHTLISAGDGLLREC